MFLVVPRISLPGSVSDRQESQALPGQQSCEPQLTDTSWFEHSAHESNSKMVFLNQVPTHPLEAQLLREKMRFLWEWNPSPNPVPRRPMPSRQLLLEPEAGRGGGRPDPPPNRHGGTGPTGRGSHPSGSDRARPGRMPETQRKSREGNSQGPGHGVISVPQPEP